MMQWEVLHSHTLKTAARYSAPKGGVKFGVFLHVRCSRSNVSLGPRAVSKSVLLHVAQPHSVVRFYRAAGLSRLLEPFALSFGFKWATVLGRIARRATSSVGPCNAHRSSADWQDVVECVQRTLSSVE